MDELTELLRLAEHQTPPSDLADRLWTDVLDTYRLTRGQAPPSSPDGISTKVIDLDDDPPVVVPFDDLQPVKRLRRGRLVVAAVALLLMLAGVGLAWVANGDTDAPAPVVDQPEHAHDDRTFSQVCSDLERALHDRTGLDARSELDAIAADLRALAGHAENGAVEGALPGLVAELERAANTLDQAGRHLDAGDDAIARQAASQAAFWEQAAAGDRLGELDPCFP